MTQPRQRRVWALFSAMKEQLIRAHPFLSPGLGISGVLS